MPAVPLRKRLLRGAFKYARRLQELRRRQVQAREGESSESEVEPDPNEDNEVLNGSDSDVSSLSSLSSLSSIESQSSGLFSSSDSEPDDEGLDRVSSSDSEEEDDCLYFSRLAAIKERVKYLEQTRVLAPNKVHKLSQLYLVLEAYKESDHKRFRRNLRVSPTTFDELRDKIQSHPIFVNESTQGQMAIDAQLAIALFRFGHFGNAASVESVAQWAGCSAGMVVNATRRVIQAVLSFHDEYIHWPTGMEKEAAKEWVEAASCAAWRDGWLFVDGTLVPLSNKPGHHGEAYFDRKHNYSLNVQLITLPNLRIVDYVIGHCGSAHDSTVFMESRTFKDHQQLIGPGEWIWADSAYPIEAWCVTPYKKPAAYVPENKKFNFWVSHVRIKSEHAVGHLKGRFQLLKGLRQQIKNETDHLRALEWIRACIILHTMIHEFELGDASADSDWEEELIDIGLSSDSSDSLSDSGVGVERMRESLGQRKRRKVKESLFASGIVGN